MKPFVSLTVCLLLLTVLALPTFAADTDPGAGDGTQAPPVVEPAPTVHTHTWNTVTTPSTCTTAGVSTSTCTGCGEVSTQALPLAAHSYGAWTPGSADHSRSCSVCSAVETVPHSWTPGEVTSQPTCTATGTQAYSCACGASKTETLPATAHSFGEWGGDETAHSRACTSCGAAESGSHIWANSTVTVPPTCTEEGVEALFCTVCNGCLYDVLPLADHTYDNVCDPDCNVCGAVREAAHKFSTVWSKNSRQHWHACTRCGDKKDVENHYPGPAATEEKAQICLTCGLTMTPKLNHTHKYETRLTSDETGHWYACSGCEDQKDLEEHSYDGPCDPDCNDCGYKTDSAHSYGSSWESDETGHWSVCTICGEAGDPESHTPDPDAGEEDAQICSVCDFEIAPARVHTHRFESQWLSDGETHWKTCECGEKDTPAPHTWDAGTEDGSGKTITYTCTQCAAEKTEAAARQGGIPWGIILVVLVLLTIATAGVLVVVLVRERKRR